MERCHATDPPPVAPETWKVAAKEQSALPSPSFTQPTRLREVASTCSVCDEGDGDGEGEEVDEGAGVAVAGATLAPAVGEALSTPAAGGARDAARQAPASPARAAAGA